MIRRSFLVQCVGASLVGVLAGCSGEGAAPVGGDAGQSNPQYQQAIQNTQNQVGAPGAKQAGSTNYPGMDPAQAGQMKGGGGAPPADAYRKQPQ